VVVDYSAASHFLVQLKQSLDRILIRCGREASVSLGDIWDHLRKHCPADAEIDYPEFRRFLDYRVRDQLRSDRRQTKRFGNPIDQYGNEPIAIFRDPCDELIRAEQLARVEAALRCLPEANRELLLARFEGRSSKTAELARSLGCSPRTIKRRQDRALDEVRRLLDQDGQTGGGS